MWEFFLFLLGLAAGAGAGVYVGRLLGRSGLADRVSALDATLGEVRGQLAARDADLTEARAVIEREKLAGLEAATRLAEGRQRLEEQRKQFEDIDRRLRETFTALSAAALKSSSEQFITLAEARMKPLREQLDRYEAQIKELEKARQEAYGGLAERLKSLDEHSSRLGRETRELVAALRQAGPKGKWGEVTLQRIVELSGMTEHCDFTTQATLEGGGRPDLIVHLPGGRSLAVDSKVNTGAYLDAHEAANEHDRQRHLARFADDVRTTLRILAGKEYWRQLTPAPEFVVMFMPGEAFFAAALSQDHDLITEGVGKGVLIASPTTLIALLLAVRHGWQQQQVAENARRIAEAGRELHERLCTFVQHLDGVRAGIEKAAQAYNKAVGNWESRTLPSARRLSELGVAEPDEQTHRLPPCDVATRRLDGAEPAPGAVEEPPV